MRIRELEYEFGVRLFDTSNRRAKLTAKGQEFLPYAEELLRMVDEITVKMTDPTAVAGTIRLGVGETIVVTWLSAFVEAMKRRHPKVLLVVEIDLADGLWRKFRSGLLDVVVVSTVLREPGISYEPLGEFEYCWMASPSLGISRETLTPAELSTFPILSLPDSSTIFQMTVEWFTRHGASPKWTNHSGSLNTLVSLAEAGLGVSLLPATLIKKRARSRKLQKISVSPAFPLIDFSVAYESHSVSPTIRATVEQLRNSSTFKVSAGRRPGGEPSRPEG